MKAHEVLGAVIAVPSLVGFIVMGVVIEYLWWFVHPEYTTRLMMIEHWKLFASSAGFAIGVMCGCRVAFR